MTLLKSLLNAPMYPKRSLYSGWLEFLKFPTLCKLWELFSLQIPRNFHSQTSFVRFHPTKAEVDIRPKIQGESHTSSWALSFCTVPASLGLCSVNFSHFKAFLTAKLLSLQLSKIFGLWLVPLPYAAVWKLSPGLKLGWS